MLGFEALAVLPLSALPAAVALPEAPDEGGSGLALRMPEPLSWRMPDEEIVFLRRKISSRAGV